MTQICPRLTRPGLALGVLVVALLLGPGTTAASAAGYTYDVKRLDYFAESNLHGERAQGGCVPGETSFWGGLGETVQGGDLEYLATGGGYLDIHRTGSSGSVTAAVDYDFTFFGAHNVWTQCPTPTQDGIDKDTDCSGTATSGVDAFGMIHGGVGDKVKISWTFGMADVAGHWVPDVWVCEGEGFLFAHGPCKSKEPLRTFTKKKVKLRFDCVATKPDSLSHINGYVTLKRASQR